MVIYMLVAPVLTGSASLFWPNEESLTVEIPYRTVV